jgi:hypothetical protein
VRGENVLWEIMGLFVEDEGGRKEERGKRKEGG